MLLISALMNFVLGFALIKTNHIIKQSNDKLEYFLNIIKEMNRDF